MAEQSTIATLKADMKAAMRAKEKERLSVIRMLISSLKNKAIDLKIDVDDISEEIVVAVFSTEAKKRRESAQAYRDADREELAAKEDAELAVITQYLPEQLSDDEVRELVKEVIAEVGAETKRDMGKVMGKMMPKVKGRFDGSKVKDLVLEQLV